MTHTPAPPPPSRPIPNWVLYGVLGLVVGLALVVLVLLLSGGDDEPVAATVNPTPAASSTTTRGEGPASTTSTSTSATSVAPTTTPAPTTTIPAFVGNTADKTAAGAPFASFAFLENVRFAQREAGFTRVVFDFEGADIPWWSVAYTTGPFSDPGDNPIAVGGTDFLEVLLSSTSFDLSGADVRITYDGPERISTNTNSVIEIVRIDDFEGVSSWVIGVDGMKAFVVGTLTDPPRVYVDIAD